MIDTKNIKIGQQEGARGFVQFFSILAQCGLVWLGTRYIFCPENDKKVCFCLVFGC